MSTISWSYWAAGAGDAKASPAEACTMVVENARAAVCRVDGREEKMEDLAECWASNLELVRSGALTTVLLRTAALAKLRLAMALIAGGTMEGRGSEGRDDDCSTTTSQWLQRRGRKSGWWW